MARTCPMIGFGGGPCQRGCDTECRALISVSETAPAAMQEKISDHAPYASDVIARWRGGKFIPYEGNA